MRRVFDFLSGLTGGSKKSEPKEGNPVETAAGKREWVTQGAQVTLQKVGESKIRRGTMLAALKTGQGILLDRRATKEELFRTVSAVKEITANPNKLNEFTVETGNSTYILTVVEE